MTAIRTAIVFDCRLRMRVIDSTRALVAALSEQLLDDADARSRIAMAVHELMENVAKYSWGGEGSVEVELAQREGHTHARVATRNRVTPEQRATLERLVTELRRAEDPVAFYDALIATSARAKGSGLGLARVAAEGRMDVALSVEGDEVTISATSVVAARTAS